MKKIEAQEYKVLRNGVIELKVITDIMEDDDTFITSKNWRTTIEPGDWDQAVKHNLDKKLKEDWTAKVISDRKNFLSG